MLLDINNFGPFHFDVWGSVSDWVMVVVTGITAYFLYHTLKSQNKTLDSQQVSIAIQNDALELEQKKYKASIQPLFSAKFESSTVDLTTLKCRFRNGHARKAKIMYRNITGYFSYSGGSDDILNWQVSMLGNKLADDEFNLVFNLFNGHAQYNIQFYIIYYDSTGENGYYQQIRYMHSTSRITYGEIREYVHNVTVFPAQFEVIPYS